MNNPTTAEIIAARHQARDTQATAARRCGVARRTWQDWERGVTAMPANLWGLYRHIAGLERIPFRAAV